MDGVISPGEVCIFEQFLFKDNWGVVLCTLESWAHLSAAFVVHIGCEAGSLPLAPLYKTRRCQTSPRHATPPPEPGWEALPPAHKGLSWRPMTTSWTQACDLTSLSLCFTIWHMEP
jgi:hypothetical protein